MLFEWLWQFTQANPWLVIVAFVLGVAYVRVATLTEPGGKRPKSDGITPEERRRWAREDAEWREINDRQAAMWTPEGTYRDRYGRQRDTRKGK